MYTDLINGDKTHYHYKPSPCHISCVTVFQLCMYVRWYLWISWWWWWWKLSWCKMSAWLFSITFHRASLQPLKMDLTFRGPCIVIYSCNKSQRDALFLKFILIKYSTCFGQIYCPSSGVSILYHSNWYLSCYLCWLSASDSQHN